MDPLTHTLIGAVAGEGFFKRRLGRDAIPLLAIASNLPDIDAIVMLTEGPLAITMRRTFGHSVFLFPLWALALAALYKRFRPEHRFGRLYAAALTGCCLHVFFDLVNSFGVVALWPFSQYRPELAIIFIIDLILTGLLAAPFIAAKLRALDRPRACRLAAVAVGLYVLACAGSRLRAELLLARQTAGSEFSYVFPEPLGPHRWRGVARTDGEYRLFLINSVTGVIEPRGRVLSRPGSPSALAARGSEAGKRLEAFFKAPVWDENGGGAVRAFDLRFRSLVVDRGMPFSFLITPGPDGSPSGDYRKQAPPAEAQGRPVRELERRKPSMHMVLDDGRTLNEIDSAGGAMLLEQARPEGATGPRRWYLVWRGVGANGNGFSNAKSPHEAFSDDPQSDKPMPPEGIESVRLTGKRHRIPPSSSLQPHQVALFGDGKSPPRGSYAFMTKKDERTPATCHGVIAWWGYESEDAAKTDCDSSVSRVK